MSPSPSLSPTSFPHLDEVLRGQGLEHGHKEADHVLVLRVLGLQEEVLVMEDDLTVHIHHQEPESLQGGERERERERGGGGIHKQESCINKHIPYN